MSSPNWWVSSGLASEAAKEVAWFVVIVFVGIGVLIWLDMRKDK